jgi:hypothetical protein
MSPAVNKPVVKEVKEADINRKLQLFGIYSAFENGKVPSNEQIDVALNSFLASKALSNPPEKLSEDGKKLVADVREVVKQAKNLLLSKNEGNLIQDFIWQTTQFDPKSVNTPNLPISKDTAQRHGDEALQGLRTLGTLLITNGQFRKLLNDATVLLRDIAGDAATNAASKVRPNEDQLAQIDQPAEANTWHEKPDLSKESIRQKAQAAYGGDIKKDAQDVANQTARAAEPATRDPNAVDRAVVGNTAVNAVQQKVDERVDPKTKENAKETKEAINARKEEYRIKTKEYLNKKMPQERKEQVIFRLKKMILECQQHPDYTEAIQTILRLAEEYGKHGRTLGQGSAGTVQDTRSAFSAAEADLRTLIERFANGTSTEDLWASIAQIYKDAEKDDELRNWFKSLDNYIRRCLLEQGYILDEASSHEWDRLYDHGRYLLREKYRTHTDRVVDEVKFIADQFDKDPQNKAFGLAVQKLFLDLGNDQDGKPVFKPHLVKDLTEIIIPAVLENVAYIPIPRIEFKDHQFDAIIENLVLESDNFAPNVLEVASDNYFRWGRKTISNKHKNSVEIKVSGVQFDLRDVSFHIKRKTGFPKITDTAVADILLPGDGFSFKIKVSSADKKDQQNFFKVEKVDVDFKSLKINVTKSNHKLLFSLFKPFALKAVRPPLQAAVEKAIKDQFNQLDQLLYQVKQEADRALQEAKSSPENAPNIYQRYYNAFQQKMTKGKKKAEEVAQDKQVNVSWTKEDSIFPNISLPGGISTKATEYKELARKGEKWESPVFSIGSAKKSSDIPTAPRIERKPHTHTNGATNGATNGSTHGLQATNGGALNGNKSVASANPAGLPAGQTVPVL